MELSAAISSAGSLIVIVALLAGAAVVLRRLRNTGWGQRAAAQNQIKLIASRAMGGQNTLVIAEAEGKRFLIGVSRAGISAIGRLDADE